MSDEDKKQTEKKIEEQKEQQRRDHKRDVYDSEKMQSPEPWPDPPDDKTKKEK